MKEVEKALNKINESIIAFRETLHADLIYLKQELKEARELKQNEIEEAHDLAANFEKKEQKLDVLKDGLNVVISTVNQHSETLKFIIECIKPFVDNTGNTIGNYDCCRNDKKERKERKKRKK